MLCLGFLGHGRRCKPDPVLLFLAGLVSACSPSTTSGSTPTPTPTQGIKGIFHEYALPPSQFAPVIITAGPDGNLWFSEVEITPTAPNGKNGKIGSLV